MKNLKRLISAVLVLCMIAACLAGCGQELEVTDPTTEPTTPPHHRTHPAH